MPLPLRRLIAMGHDPSTVSAAAVVHALSLPLVHFRTACAALAPPAQEVSRPTHRAAVPRIIIHHGTQPVPRSPCHAARASSACRSPLPVRRRAPPLELCHRDARASCQVMLREAGWLSASPLHLGCISPASRLYLGLLPGDASRGGMALGGRVCGTARGHRRRGRAGGRLGHQPAEPTTDARRSQSIARAPCTTQAPPRRLRIVRAWRQVDGLADHQLNFTSLHELADLIGVDAVERLRALPLSFAAHPKRAAALHEARTAEVQPRCGRDAELEAPTAAGGGGAGAAGGRKEAGERTGGEQKMARTTARTVEAEGGAPSAAAAAGPAANAAAATGAAPAAPSLRISQIFARRYTASGRPWFGFHRDKGPLTVNVALQSTRARTHARTRAHTHAHRNTHARAHARPAPARELGPPLC